MTEGGAPASIHEIVKVKQEGLLDHLRYDAYERRSALVRVVPADTTPEAIASGSADELTDLRDGTWALEDLDADRVVLRRLGHVRSGDRSIAVEATKTIWLSGGRTDPRLDVQLVIARLGDQVDKRLDALVALEWSTMLLGGGHNPGAWHDLDGRRIAHDETATAIATSRMIAGNDQLGITVETTTDRPVDGWIAPIETVSNSEGGFELVYQGSTTWLVAPLRLAPGESTSLRVSQHVTVRAERFGGAADVVVDDVVATDAERLAPMAPVEVEPARR